VPEPRRIGPFDFWGWLKAQMALMPLLAFVGAVAMIAADARYDARYVAKGDGASQTKAIEEIKASVADVKTTQAVNAEKIQTIQGSISDLKKGQEVISDKLDRLIERSH
jgi:hypothetical protein